MFHVHISIDFFMTLKYFKLHHSQYYITPCLSCRFFETGVANVRKGFELGSKVIVVQTTNQSIKI